MVAALPAGQVEVLAKTGRWVDFGGKGPAIGLRAELDALPVVERTGAAWSATGNLMHACGHDVHMAALVAVCRAAARISLPRPIVAILQPGEEVAPSGGADVAESGLLEDLDSVIAAHVQPQLPAGILGVTPGPTNAGTDVVDIAIRGVGGHGGYPHTVRDPVLAMCQVVVSLQQLASRRVDPTVGTVLTIGSVHAGTTSNVVPEHAHAQASLRVMRDFDRVELLLAMEKIVTHTALAHGCTAPARSWTTTSGPSERTIFALLPPHARADALRRYGGRERPGSPGLHSDRFMPDDALIEQVGQALIAGYLGAITARAPSAQ